MTTLHQEHPARALSLGDYVERRNGTPLGRAGLLRTMLHRSLGAESFAAFWRHWNPIWGYGLGRFVYAPAHRLVPAPAAVLITFLVSGLLHDAATTLVRGVPTLVVTPWFLLLALAVLASRATGMDLTRRPWWLRAVVNLAHVVGCLVASRHLASLVLAAA